jgi:hypothetical protein
MPVIKKTELPEWANPQDESVMSPLWKTLVRKAVGVMGIDDPNSVMGTAAPMETPMISIYADKAAREAATNAFYQKIKEFAKANAVPNIQKAGKWLVDNYPRVAAHMTVSPELIDQVHPYTPVAQAVMSTESPVRSPMALKYSKAGVDASRAKSYDAVNTMAHEATHAAQALGNKDFNPLYSAANEAVGYMDNPYEKTARDAGYRAAETLKRERSTVPYIKYTTPRRDMMPSPTNARFERVRNELVDYFKAKGISLDQVHEANGEPVLKLRKWGSDYTNPENYVNFDQFKDDPFIQERIKDMVAGNSRLGYRPTVPYTASRGLDEIVDKSVNIHNQLTGPVPASVGPTERQLMTNGYMIDQLLKDRAARGNK